jgi:hypothetical protein
MAQFKPGMKVVCIDDDFSMHPMISEHYKVLPKKDITYTIRQVRPAGAEGGILLDEIKNPPIFFTLYQGKLEPAFNPIRFAPLDELHSEEAEKAVEELIKELDLVNI